MKRFIRQSFIEVLELEGYDVIAVDNGKSGLEVLDENSVDLVICDYLMSEMDGNEGAVCRS